MMAARAMADDDLGLLPHAPSKFALFDTNNVEVYRSGLKTSVAEPLPDQRQRDAMADGMDPKPMPKALGGTVRPVRTTRSQKARLNQMPGPPA